MPPHRACAGLAGLCGLDCSKPLGGSTTIAKAVTDANSAFQFPPVPHGRYRVSLVGFTTSHDFVRIKDRSQTACDRCTSLSS